VKVFRNLLAALTLGAATQAVAQNPVVVGVTGVSRAQPGIAVLAGRGLDSVRAIVQRDLQNSDRFTVALLTDSTGTLVAPFDPAAVKGTGLTWVVELQPAVNGVELKLWDVASGTVRQQATRALDARGIGDSRITIHQASDQIVNWTGGLGIAATRIVFKMKNGAEDAIWRIDADGANLVPVWRSKINITPTWSPDNSAIAYSENSDSRWTLYVQKLSTGTRTAVATQSPGSAYGAVYSPDGRSMAFTFLGSGAGSLIEVVDVTKNCCAHELTHDRRNADNSSPTYSPNGRQIAYISNRTGTPQIWVMDAADGLSAEQAVPVNFDDKGRALDTYSPSWSPDGTRILFARDVAGGSRQLYMWTVGSVSAVALTSYGKNEDPSWAPDSRHVVFKSRRSGREQLWIYDVETTSFRQLDTPGGAQYPAWSHTFGTNP
jgi:TolB protein